MSEVMRRWWWKMVYMTDLRWVRGEGEAVMKILMGTVLSRMMVFEG
jgi:hypothetical protein